MKRRSRSWLAPTSAAAKSPISTAKPSRRRSRQTRSAPPDESMPPTFSMRTNQAPDWTTMRRAVLQRSRSSSWARRLPARLCGWQGMPPMTPSRQPRQARPAKVRASLHTGAGARRPARIAATRCATAKASLSTMQTMRASGIASSTPRSSPPPPVQRERMRAPARGRGRSWGRRATFTHPSPARAARAKMAARGRRKGRSRSCRESCVRWARRRPAGSPAAGPRPGSCRDARNG